MSITSRSSTCRPLCVAFVVVLGWGLLAPAILSADETPTPTRRSIARIDPLDAWSRFDFGRDFAVDGPLLVAGAPSRDGRYSGTAYVLELLPDSSVDGQMVWLQQARLYDGFSRRAPNPGEVVDLDDGVVAVAEGRDVDFWQRDALGQWTLFDHFSGGEEWGNRIFDVALRGDELLTVQTEADPDEEPAVVQAERSGATWQVLGYVPLPAAASLDVDGDRLLAGTRIADRDLITGVFELSTTLSPPPGSESSGFGDASALAGEVVAVGAPADVVDGSHSGSVYVYERDPHTGEWLLAQRLAPSNAQAGRRFGSAVDVDGDRLLVAAPGTTSVAGAVYVFERDSSGDFVETLILDAEYDAEFATAFIPGPVVLDGELAYARGRTPQGTEAILAFYLGADEVEPAQAQFFVPPQCASEPVLELRGKSVSIDEHQSVSYRVDGGPEHYLCLDCHPEPAFTFGFDVPLESCQATRVDLEVQSYVGPAGGDSVTLYYDPQPPTFDCTPRTLVIPYGEWVGGGPPESAWVDVSDNCPAGASRWCYVRDLWDSLRAPLGTSKIECLAIDRCHESTCVYDLTVYEDTEPIAPSCQRYDFRTPDGLFLGGLYGFTEAELGDGETVELLGGTRWMVQSSSMLDEGDNGAFFYQEHERDVRLEMDVPMIYGFGGDDAKAGLMIRRDLDMWAPRMMAMWVPASGVIQFHLRPQAGDAGHFLVPPVPLGEIDKMALEIAGDTVTASVSEDDGATWQVLGSAILELGATPLVGMAASSDHEISHPGPLTAPPAGDGESPQALVAASYGDGVIDVRLERLVVCSALGPPLDSCAGDDFANWQAASLGNADQLDVQLEGGVLSLTAAGPRSGDADHMGFAYREVTGDFFATVAVDTRELDGGERRAASLQARTDLDADGRRLAVSYFPQSYYRPFVRITAREAGGEPLSIGSVRPFGAPQMLMAIERRGDTLIARHSYDEGRSWESSETWQTDLPATLLLGVAVESDDAAVAGTAHFSDFTLCGPAGDTLPTCGFDDFGDETLAEEWTVKGVGNANQVSVAESGGMLELTADGATAFAGADNAGFVYRAVTGDFRAEVTVDGEGMVTGGAYRKAGLMVRAGLDPWAVRLLAQLAPYWNDGTDTHLQVVAREERDGWGNIAVATDVTGVPRTLRLAIERRGDLFEVQYSEDGGATWITPGGGLDGTIVLEMPATVLVGLDMVSNDISVTSTARFDAFSLCPPGLSGCSGDDFEDDAVGAEWNLVGVGNANQVSAAETGGVLELTADGATAFAGADNAGLLFRQVTGDFRAEVTVDGEGMDTGGAYRKAGLMLRAGLDPWAVRVLAQLAPYWNDGPGTHLQMVARETPGGWGNIALAADIEGVPRQLRLALERQGDEVSVHYSEDGGLTWTSPDSIELDLPETVYLGLDVVSNDISVTSTARFDDFFVCTEP